MLSIGKKRRLSGELSTTVRRICKFPTTKQFPFLKEETH